MLIFFEHQQMRRLSIDLLIPGWRFAYLGLLASPIFD